MKKKISIVIVLVIVLVIGLYTPVLASFNNVGNHDGFGDGKPHNKKNYITIVLPDARLRVERYGTMRYVDVDFNDGTWRIQIPKGVRIWDVKGGAARKLIVDENGDIEPGVWFMRGEPVVTRL